MGHAGRRGWGVITERRGSPPYRTVLFLMFLGTLMVLTLALSRGQGEAVQKVAGDVIYGLLGLGFVQAGKSSVQYLGAGGGVKGAIAALMTPAKPGDPPPPPPPPPAPAAP